MPSMIPSVAVIMSTYNGERYLAEQIDSILAQKNVHVELFIRDDGSKDNTREIISDYVKRYNNIHAEFGSNMGWIRSFIYALQNAPDFDYYAFSDQDDFWLEEKLITAVNAIQREENEYGKNIPVICQTNAFITDGNLNVLKQTHTEGRLATVYSFALREIGRGCCMVLNAKVRELSRHMNDSKLFYDKAHDVALAEMTVAVGGRFVIEPAPLMKYRQHGDNSLGAPSSLIKRIKYELIALTDIPDIKNRYCWHCGGSKYKTKGGSLYKVCTSANSIGIEMCSTNSAKKVTNPNDTNWYFTDAVIANCVELTKKLMEEYDIKADHIIRHYDVNGKPCPGVIGWNEDTNDISKWQDFIIRVSPIPEEIVIEEAKEEIVEVKVPEVREELKLEVKEEKSEKIQEKPIEKGLFEALLDIFLKLFKK